MRMPGWGCSGKRLKKRSFGGLTPLTEDVTLSPRVDERHLQLTLAARVRDE